MKVGPYVRDVMPSRLGEVTNPTLPRKAQQRAGTAPVPQTDTGGRVENTKAIGRTMVKELGKLPP